MKNYISAALLVSVCLATPALANETSNTRVYAGVLAGYDSVELEAFGQSGDKSNVAYAIFGGVESDISDVVVLGVEAELGDSEVSTSVTDVFYDGDRVKVSAGRDIYAGIKIGFRVAPPVTIYAKGGYTNLQIRGKYSVDGDTYRDNLNNDGYRIGAGAEYGTGPLRFLAEYRYSDYGNVKIEGEDTGIKARRSQVMAGVKYAF